MFRKYLLLMSFVLVTAMSLSKPAGAELVGWWKLDEGTGTVFLDETPYWNDGTISPWNEAKVRWTTNGYDSNALEFVSATGPFTMCDAPMRAGLLDMQNATASFWMNIPKAYQAWGIIFDLLSASSENSIELDSNAALYISIYGLGLWFSGSTGGLNDGNWHHVTLTFSQAENTLAVYLDSKLDTTRAYSFSQAITTVRIGGPRQYNAVWRRMVGRLDEVAVFNHALSATEVRNLFWYGPESASFATTPSPADKATVTTGQVTLSWTAGQNASRHHLYIGTDFNDVKIGAASTDKGLLQIPSFSNFSWELGETYYWRVDEVEADGVTTHTGVVWSFTITSKIASAPVPANGAVLADPNVTLSWNQGSGAVSRDVYFGTNPSSLTLISQGQTTAMYDPSPTGILNYNTKYYWRVDEFDGTNKYQGDLWSFKTTPNIQIIDPNLLGWYTFNDDEGTTVIDWSGNGNHGTITGNPNRVAGYDGYAMQFDGVDDVIEVTRMVQNDLTAMAWINTSTVGLQGSTGREGSGLIWSDYSGGGDHFLVSILDTKLAFETGPSPVVSAISNKDVVTNRWTHVAVTRTQSSGQIEIFIDGVSDVTATSTTRDLGGSLKIAFGGNLIDSRFYTGAMDEVRFYNRVLTGQEIQQAMRGNPLLAWNPQPANGSTPDIERLSSLVWTPGDNAVKHQVYFGTDQAAVENATTNSASIYRGVQDTNSFTPSETLAIKQTYYWRIDEVASDATVTNGKVWSFTIADFLVVDDFEDYDDADNRIYKTWGDYYVNNTGMTVGHLETPFAEVEIVHSGSQAMYMRYDNNGTVNEGTDLQQSGTKLYSEAEREWQNPQDWTRRGANSLTIWFRGIPESVGSFAQTGENYTLTASGADIWGTADQFHFAYKRLSDVGSITAKVVSVSNTHAWAKAGVMIRESLAANSAQAAVVITPESGVSFPRRPNTGAASESTTQAGITAPQWVKLTRSGNDFTAEYSSDGIMWTPLGTAITIPMSVETYVGLCLTSHNVNATCTAEFTNVTLPAAATGQWQSQDIGIESNTTEPLYIVLYDSAGNYAVVNHNDPAATTIATYTPWDIPLTSFVGVNTQAVKKIAIGVGNRTNTQPGSAGTLYIDDIRLYLP